MRELELLADYLGIDYSGPTVSEAEHRDVKNRRAAVVNQMLQSKDPAFLVIAVKLKCGWTANNIRHLIDPFLAKGKNK